MAIDPMTPALSPTIEKARSRVGSSPCGIFDFLNRRSILVYGKLSNWIMLRIVAEDIEAYERFCFDKLRRLSGVLARHQFHRRAVGDQVDTRIADRMT